MAKQKTVHLTLRAFKENVKLENCIETGKGKEADNQTGIPNARIFIFDTPAKKPHWSDYLKITNDLESKACGCIVLFKVGKRPFALTFGYVHHYLNDINLEYDFPIIVALNCLEKDSLKSVDSTKTEITAQQRTQVLNTSSLNLFNFDGGTDILKAITGRVQNQYKKLFSLVNAGNSLHINPKSPIQDIPKLCKKLIELYKKDDYKTVFPELGKINLVRDPQLKDELTEKAVDLFFTKSPDIKLGVNGILDYSKGLRYSYSFPKKENSETYDFLEIEDLYSYVN